MFIWFIYFSLYAKGYCHVTAQLEFLYLIRYTYLVDRNLIVENYLNSDRDPTSSIACLKVVSSCLKVPLTFGTFEGHNSIILGL